MAWIPVLLLLALAGGLAWYAKSSHDAVALMKETPTSPAGKISGPGYYEVKGKAVCGSPLAAPGSGESCIYYRHVITEYYEESVRNSEGEYETKQGSRTVKDEEKSVYFQVQDASGTIDVMPTGATFQGHSSSTGGREDSSWEAESAAQWGYSAYEDQGQKHTVTSIPIGTQLYVLGRVSNQGGNLAFGRDAETKKPFIISTRSEEDEIASYDTAFKAGAAGAGLALLGALYFALQALAG